MKNHYSGKIIAATAVAIIAGAMLSACGSKDNADSSKETAAETTAATSVTSAQTTAETTTSAAETTPTEETEQSVSVEEMMSLWTEDAQAKDELISYMDAITDESSSDYIPVEDRIAVFDLDGTLFCETDPNYFDYTLLKYRVLEDPDYKDKASDFEKETAEKIAKQNETGESFEGLEVDHGKAVASAFAGMTLDEFNDYIQEFKQQDMPSYEGMKRGEGFYQPMLQLVEYLQANDFTVYVVSGTDHPHLPDRVQ